MAEKTTAGKTVSVPLPLGMSAEQFTKLLATFQKTQDYTKKRDKAVREALNVLKKAHPEDYKKALEVELAKAGLTVKGA